jgi:hypothetical protein
MSAAAKKENAISGGIFINRFPPGYLRGRVQPELNRGIRLQSKGGRRSEMAYPVSELTQVSRFVVRIIIT